MIEKQSVRESTKLNLHPSISVNFTLVNNLYNNRLACS